MVYIITKPYWLCLADEAGAMRRYSFKTQRKRLSDQIIESIIAVIANGELKPGDKLRPEPQLMGQFGVGMSSIQEAIGALELIRPWF
jgi:GntR family transcriptional repressor for pyruvate dehydrogenase complex